MEPRPLNRGDHLIQVANTKFVWEKIQDCENWLLNRGWLLYTGPLYTGSTLYSSVLEKLKKKKQRNEIFLPQGVSL